MTVIAVLASPPREGLVLPDLPETSPLSPVDATALYGAMLRDTFRAVERSGGDLLVNYPETDQLPAAFRTDIDPVAELRAFLAEALDDVSAVRFEPQVGSTFSARAGNTATHLLREEGATSVAVVRGTAPLLTRLAVDSAAMKLRTNEVVIGPAPRGRTYYAGFTEPIDFADAFAGIEQQRLADRAADAGLSTDFLPLSPAVETGADLLTLVPMLRSRLRAERIVPEHTAAFVHEQGLDVVVEDGETRLVRD
ncbi:MAG: hypothetical protein ACOCPZ_02475 [Natrialbaceae archaeon]